MKDLGYLERSLKREQAARFKSEGLLEDSTRELYLTNEKLSEQNKLISQYVKKVDLFLSIIKTVNQALAFDDQLSFFIKAICDMSGWPVGHVYEPDPEQNDIMNPTKIWYFKDNILEAFKTITEKTSLKKGKGLPGRVYGSGKPYWIPDITKDNNFSRTNFLKDLGLKSGFAVPIVIQGKIVAVCEFFSPTIVEEDTYLLKIVEAAAEQLAFSIEQGQKQVEHEKQLQYQVTHDSLTGLPNRLLLMDRIEQAIKDANRNKKKVAIIFIDLDRFKNVNDGLGHAVGDELLRNMSERLGKTIRDSDTLARFGGDEFVLVMPDLDNISVVPLLLKKITTSISKPYLIKGQEINITCSLGFSVYPDNGLDAERLLKNADTAMYQAKESGRDNYQFFTPDMNTKISNRIALENGLSHALEKNELSVEYQPKLDFNTNAIVGMEALMRWKSPTFGIVSPRDFIPIADEMGLIIPLGKWILKAACAQNKVWQDAGLPPVVVSVNLASRQFKEPNFVQTIRQVLEETKLPPQYLELELTESLAMDNPEGFIETLYHIKKLGVRLSIDNFGTGHSSLSYLRQFPVDWLKIDHSFIESLTEGKGERIVDAIISLGHSLNMKVIAEGVETSDQFKDLKKHSCDQMQGYYISHPLPPEKFAQFLSESAKKT